jgi:hypothetical protein
LAPTIFHQPWWLDAVAPGQWRQVEVATDGRTVGRFAFVMAPVLWGHRLCTMPPMTHFLGPAIDEGRGAACNRILRRNQITRQLLAAVPKASGFWHKLHRGTDDTLVYQDLGYRTAVQFTFEISPAPAPVLWSRMRDKTRNVIRRAGESLLVGEDTDAAGFAAFYLDNIARKGEQSRYPAELITTVCREAACRGCGRILYARTPGGTLVAAIFYVWDTDAAYYLLSTRREDAHNGAVSLLLWHAMRDVAGRGLVFDFEGVINSGSALFFTGFGGEVAPRYIVARHTLGHRLAGRLSNPWRRRALQTYL